MEPVADSKEALDRVLRFRVQAVLLPDQDAEHVVFLSTLEPSSGKYQVAAGLEERRRMTERILPYYQGELSYIRRLLDEFSAGQPDSPRGCGSARAARTTRTWPA